MAPHPSRIIEPVMQAAEFDEVAFFRALDASGVRALLIGRRALVTILKAEGAS